MAVAATALDRCTWCRMRPNRSGLGEHPGFFEQGDPLVPVGDGKGGPLPKRSAVRRERERLAAGYELENAGGWQFHDQMASAALDAREEGSGAAEA
jgi:hypothetical protein